MSEDKMTKVIERISALEAHTKTWQDAHDKRSDDNWCEMKSNMAKIFHWLETLPCRERASRYDFTEISISRLWWAVGTIVTVMTIMVGWIIHAKSIAS